MKKILRRLLITVGSLALLLAAFHAVENIRGRRAWLAWKSAREAAGQRYEPAAYTPKAIPDAENFAATSLMVEAIEGKNSGSNWVIPTVFTERPTAGDWRAGKPADYAAFAAELKGKSLEAFLEPFDAPLEALAEAARRPASRFKIDYTRDEQIPQLLGMRARARVLRLRALARLQAGRPEAALEDVLTGLRVIRHFQNEPHLITQLLRMAYVNILMQPIWEGLQGHAWNEAQLARLQAELAPIDLLASMKLAWQFERIGAVSAWTKSMDEDPGGLYMGASDPEKPRGWLARTSQRWLIPKGWLHQNLLNLDRAFEEQIVAVVDPGQHVVHVGLYREALARYKHPTRRPYTWIALNALPAMVSQNIRVAQAQSAVDQARIACALERHRLAKGAYPEALHGLVPTFMAEVPHDVVGGMPLRYIPQGTAYRLYSLGWNGTDEGGQIGPDSKDSGTSAEQGDWVWAAGQQVEVPH